MNLPEENGLTWDGLPPHIADIIDEYEQAEE